MGFKQRLRSIDARRYHGWRWVVARSLQFVIALVEQLAHDKVLIRASGLAYATLLAVVPLAAVLFALFTAFASFEDLRDRVQDFLFSQLLPTRQDEIVAYINQFTENTHRLGFVGFIVLIFTAILLLDNIETNFNAIWHVTIRRRIVAKITAYTSVLVFGTVFLGASLSISARLKALIFTGSIPELGFINRTGTWLFPLSLSFLAFLIMYLVIPYTKVHFRSAVVGAIIGSVLWESGKNLFANSVGQSVRYSTIYGSLAVIPIFLVWIYITWIVVLLGLEVTFTHQHLTALVRRSRFRVSSERERFSLAFKIYAIIALRFHRGEPPPTVSELADRFRVPIEAVEHRVLTRLSNASLVRRVDCEQSDGCGLVPSTSLERVEVSDLLRAMLGAPGDANGERDRLDEVVERLMDSMQEAAEAATNHTSARDLVAMVSDADSDDTVLP